MTLKRPDTRRAVSHLDTRQHKDIDQEIRKYEEAVRDLKSQRNTLAPIAKLPPELLSKIFLFCAAACASKYKQSLAWIKVSHVSKHWRAVAIGCPNLWSSVVFFSGSWAHEMLRRSKMAPLIIKADLTLMTPKMIATVQNALKHITRVTDLHFTASSGTMDKLLGNLEHAAPLLQTLSISHTYPSYHYKNERYVFPDTFLKGDAPKLEKLELVGCSIPWNSTIFHNLTHLKIFDTGAQFCPSLDQLVEALDKMPKLECLDLTDCLPILPVDAISVSAPLRVVELPRLQQLKLCSQTLESANVLNHISFPASVTVNLVCRGSDASDSDFSSLVPALANWLNGARSIQPLQRLLVDHFSTNSIRFQAWNHEGVEAKSPSSIPILDMVLSWKHFGAHVVEHVISTICASLPLSQLRVLHVWQSEVIRSAAWVSIFGAMSKLRTIDVHGSYGHELVKALSMTAQSPVTFPYLRTLALDEVNFMVDRTDELTMLEPFMDCLMLRSEYGSEIRRLKIKRCSHILEADVEALNQVVVDVSWDGIESGFGDDSEEDGFDSDEDFYGRRDPFYPDNEYYPLGLSR